MLLLMLLGSRLLVCVLGMYIGTNAGSSVLGLNQLQLSSREHVIGLLYYTIYTLRGVPTIKFSERLWGRRRVFRPRESGQTLRTHYIIRGFSRATRAGLRYLERALVVAASENVIIY